MVKIKPHHVHLICNAKYHDTDFARSELVNLFSEHYDLGVSISQDYSDFYKFTNSERAKSVSWYLALHIR